MKFGNASLHSTRARRMIAVCALLGGSVMAASVAQAQAQDAAASQASADNAGQIVVTAQKRAQYLQDVPISLEAFGAKKLEENAISSFDDYAKLLPSVSFQSFGPGQSQIYFRGVSSGADANGSHGGPQPTSALYLDEIPLTTIGGAPDLHIYDIERVEALSGPQGTLYGASSLSGTLRLITKAPNPNKWEAGIDVTGTTYARGSNSSGGTIEAFINAPIAKGIALRVSGFFERDGGYISNIPATRTYGAYDQNGNPVTLGPYSNAAYVKKNFNDNETTGGRAALGIDLNDNWHLEPSVIYQHQAIHGTYLFDPTLGDLQVQDFAPDFGSDEWVQAALTIKGKIGNWDLTYAGGYFSRTAVIVQDYSDYSVAYSAQNPYYSTFFDANGNNLDPTQHYVGKDIYSKLNNELRISSPAGEKWRVTLGGFLERQTDKIIADYTVTGLAGELPASSYNYAPYVNAVPTCGDDVYCTRDYRVDRDYAGFIDASYDLTRTLSVDAGVRYFYTKNSLGGFSGLASRVLTSGTPVPNISCILGTGGFSPCNQGTSTTSQSGETHKVNVSWKVVPGKLVYFTYSTGFRPGGVNRVAGVLPYRNDTLANFEIGAKTEWLNRRLTVNIAGFIEHWHDVQFGLAPPGAIGVLATYNAGEAHINGVEGNFNLRLAPLTLSGSGSYIDATLASPFCNFGAGNNPDCSRGVLAPVGTQLPVQPRFKGNLTARYDFTVNTVKAWFQLTENFQSGTRSYLTNNPNTGLPVLPNTDSFATVDFTIGAKFNRYTFEAFIDNASDSRGVLSVNPICVPTICGAYARDYPIKPRLIGVKVSARY